MVLREYEREEAPSVPEVREMFERYVEAYRRSPEEARRLLLRWGFGEEEAELLQAFSRMFEHPLEKVVRRLPARMLERYRFLHFYLALLRSRGAIPVHPDYTGGNDLARRIFERAYYLRVPGGDALERRPEDLFMRVAAFIAAAEGNDEAAALWARRFYIRMYEGKLSPAGRIRAGAGDLYTTKTLSNCYMIMMEEDSIEAIWETAYRMARTYSFGGGVGIDVTPLRPRGSPVHNASFSSTGPVSFMDIFSLTTGTIGQEGRRGALMITMHVKHPDILEFITCKRTPNWIVNQILDQLRMDGVDEETLEKVKRRVIENVRVRFANISIKVTDEFMQALEEQDRFGPGKILVYKKKYKGVLRQYWQDRDGNYSYGIPSKDVSKYELWKVFDSVDELNDFLSQFGARVSEEDLRDPFKRDVYGDYVVETDEEYDLAIRYAGDFLLYYGNPAVGEVRRLVKARDIWNVFVESNYRTAEPGLIFWSRMTRYSPSNYVGVPIAGTNPCGELPLEHGGACVLSSLNLLAHVRDPYRDAVFDWEDFRESVRTIVRFLDDVVTWNIYMHPLDIQRRAMARTRRIGAGIMGLADMLNALGMAYDSEEALAFVDRLMSFYANEAYSYSADLAEEKGVFEVWDYERYARNPFFREVLLPDVQEKIREKGLRNVSLLAVAPTGNTSNSTRALEVNGKVYVGVSSGIEPVFALYYSRRTEAIDSKVYRIFHPPVQAYLDMMGLSEAAQSASEEELRDILPEHFFHTAHTIDPLMRVRMQGTIQRYIDSSISSTVNLPEDIHPETISDIYKAAWRHGLKGITIYRDGSRFPILIVEGKKTEFQVYKEKRFRIYSGGKTYVLRGDDVIVLPDGRLSTVYHAIKEGVLRRRA